MAEDNYTKTISYLVPGVLTLSLALNLAGSLSAETPPSDLTPIAPEDIPPAVHNYYSLQSAVRLPPMPFNWLSGEPDVLLYFSPSRPTNAIWVGDQNINYAQRAAEAQVLRLAIRAAENDGPPSPGGGTNSGGGGTGGGWSGPIWGTNDFYLEAVSVTNGLFNAILHNTTNGLTYLALSAGAFDPSGSNVWLTDGSFVGSESNATAFALGVGTRTNSLLLRAQGCDECAGSVLPLDWQLMYFGVTGMDPNADMDGDGQSLLYECTNGIDPNKIQLSIYPPPRYLNTTPVPLQLNVTAGAPSYIAVLVNEPELGNASWLPYTGTNINVNLGATDGVYMVSVGLRGLPDAGQQTWQSINLSLDTAAPLLVITDPVGATTTRPLTQLRGYTTKPLSEVRYDTSNALAVVTNQRGSVRSQYFDPLSACLTTNWFQCYDIALAPGPNTITVRVTDRAGNTTSTNLTMTLDYSTATNPLVQLVWPQDGFSICADSFTCRGTVDDPTATVTARISGTNGSTRLVAGIVGRYGDFWLEHLPLTGGTNVLTIDVTNAAGLATVTSLALAQAPVVLAMDPLPSESLWQPSVSVTGTVSDTSCSITVNGKEGVNNGDGTWYALAVPASPGGVATFDLAAQSGGSTFGNNRTTDRPAQIVVTTYGLNWTNVFVPATGGGSGHHPNFIAMAGFTEKYSLLWQEDVGTKATDTMTTAGVTCTTNYTWPADQYILGVVGPTQNGISTNDCSSETGQVAPPEVILEHCAFATNFVSSAGTNRFSRTAQAVLTLLTGGKGRPQHQRLFQISGGAFAVTNLTSQGGYWVPSAQVAMGTLGTLGAEGSITTPIPDDETKDITPTVLAALNPDYYVFSASQTNYSLRIMLGTNDVTDTSLDRYVGQLFSFTGVLAPAGGPALTNFHWTVPETALSNFFVSADALQTNGYPVPLTRKTNADIGFCWVDPGLKVLACKATAAGHEMAATTVFSIKRPNARLEARIQTGVEVEGNFLRFMNSAFSGISFMPRDLDTEGLWEYFQTGHQLARYQAAADGTWSRQEGRGLDTVYPNALTQDSPLTGLPDDGMKTTVIGTFTTYLGFRASPGDVLVPIREITWSWEGTAVTNGLGQWVGGGTATVDPQDSEAPATVSWTNNIMSTLGTRVPEN